MERCTGPGMGLGVAQSSLSSLGTPLSQNHCGFPSLEAHHVLFKSVYSF